jgi:predicted nucleic acid-binding protein
MKEVFADTGYWIAVLYPDDPYRRSALTASGNLNDCRFVTSDMVLSELLNAFAGRGAALRSAAGDAAESLRKNPRVVVVPQTSAQFAESLARYRARPDKGWSLTDCASFLIMEERGIGEALAHDRHFEQAGFRALLRDG